MGEIRTVEQRKSDVLLKLGEHPDAWLATATSSGEPHLIVVATVWRDDRILIATRGPSQTASNLAPGRRARLGLGQSEDVVMIDVEVERSLPAGTGGELAAAFVQTVGWDPVDEGPDWVYVVLRPMRIQAYMGYGELRGRDVMKAGRWLA